MGCSVDKFTITKGMDNNYPFVIKQTGTTLPMELTLTDTFTCKLITLEDSVTVLTKALTLDTLLEGKVDLLLTEAEVDGLVSERGSKVDRYYPKPTYKLLIDCSTTNNGDFIAKVDEVYVD